MILRLFTLSLRKIMKRISLGETSLSEQSLRNLIDSVMSSNFNLFYQPVVNIKTGLCTHMEALSRIYINNTFCTFAPYFYIKANNSESEIFSRNVLRKTFEDLHGLAGNGFTPITSINVHLSDITNQFVSEFEQLVETTGIPASSIILEISESSDLHITQYLLSRMSSLRSLGAQIAIDDYGKGFSTYARLGKIPVDLVKLDKSLIHESMQSKSKAIGFGALVSEMKQRGLSVVAEGIETAEQLDMCNQSRVDLIQGYYISKPLHKDLLLDWESSFKHSIQYGASDKNATYTQYNLVKEKIARTA
jgi:EAL domain-containing protein (putative c-di-GMP-specific phosphodiesterase class I)